MSAFFVTGSGTDVGKTFVASGLIGHWRDCGRVVEALKPVASGFDPAFATASDPGVLLTALGRCITPEAIERIAPWRFKAPLSPDMAAAREGNVIDFDALVRFSRKAVTDARDVLLIEGVGGIMVPLDGEHTVLDWICALRLPVVLVVGSYLGSISHTLTCVDVLRRRQLDIAALVVNESAGSTVPLHETAAAIGRFATPVPVMAMARLAPGDHEQPSFAELADLLMPPTG
jgi:dethiobiotin synthetase